MDAAKAVNTYLEALPNGDVETIVGLYAHDAHIEDPVGSPRVEGHDAIRAFYGRSIQAISGARLLGPIRVAGQEVAFPFEITMQYNGQMLVMDIIDTFRFDTQGRIVEMRAFWSEANMRPA
jgi:steroid Delta-isomerase